MDAYNIAFGRVETHSPFLCPCAKCIQITLEDPLVTIGLNLTVCETVISKQAGLLWFMVRPGLVGRW